VPFGEAQGALVGYDQWHPSRRKSGKLFPAYSSVDVIAERAVQLVGIAQGTTRMVAKRSSLPEYPANAVDGRSHVEALSSALAAFGKSARQAIDTADDLSDLDTEDVFMNVSHGID
jgi:starvation-inducible DNA-binding protein